MPLNVHRHLSSHPASPEADESSDDTSSSDQSSDLQFLEASVIELFSAQNADSHDELVSADKLRIVHETVRRLLDSDSHGPFVYDCFKVRTEIVHARLRAIRRADAKAMLDVL